MNFDFVRPCDYEWVKGEREFERKSFRRFADGFAALLETNLTRQHCFACIKRKFQQQRT